MSTEPGRASRDHRAVDAHSARAWLVDYVAACHRDADAAYLEHDRARGDSLVRVADDLSSLLRRWDVTHDGHTPP